MATMTTSALVVILKASALTLKQITALDPTDPLLRTPGAAIQAIKALGIHLTVTTNANGEALYKIDA